MFENLKKAFHAIKARVRKPVVMPIIEAVIAPRVPVPNIRQRNPLPRKQRRATVLLARRLRRKLATNTALLPPSCGSRRAEFSSSVYGKWAAR